MEGATISALVGWLDMEEQIKSPACRMEGESRSECVSRKIPELIEMEGMERSQAVAVANSLCEKRCSEKESSRTPSSDSKRMGEPALEGAIVLEDQEKFSAIPGESKPIEIHYRITTPFQVTTKADMEDDDVKIRGPVYVGNDEMLDRHGELVESKAILEAWKAYSLNPVILYNHSKNYGVIGRMDSVEMGSWEGIGEVVIGNAIIDGGEKDITRKIKKGFLKAFSIGFIAKAAVKECEDEDSCYLRFTEIDWIETSVVDIPASANALFNVEKHILHAHAHTKEPCGCGGDCCSGKGEKEMVEQNVFTTPDEAISRAREIGCVPPVFHTIWDAKNGRTLYLPCKDRAAQDEAEASKAASEIITKDISLNRPGEETAAKCINAGDMVMEGSWEPPSAEAGNAYIEEHGWQAYGMWFLGKRSENEPDTKEYYAYPWSPNFKDCSRPALNAIRSRAGQTGDEGVFRAAGRLRELMDDRKEGIEFVKEEVGTDIYTTSDEAETRAQELGCEGSHSMEGPEGETLFMPCKNHDEYEGTLEEPDLPMKNIEADSKPNLSDSVMNPLGSVVKPMSDEVAVTEDPIEETLVETKEVETPVEDKVVIEEVTEATEEESVEELDVIEMTQDEVLVELVSVVKTVVDQIQAMSIVLDTTATQADEITELTAQVAESEAAKSAAEAEAAIESEVNKRVAEVLAAAGSSPKKVAERKTLTTVPIDHDAPNTFDPSQPVSEGMNGLAKWLETQIATR